MNNLSPRRFLDVVGVTSAKWARSSTTLSYSSYVDLMRACSLVLPLFAPVSAGQTQSARYWAGA
jgi:hypothetical protein